MKTSLYPYQTELASQVLNEFKAGRTNVVLAAACGAGKTITSIALCEELLQKDPTLRILVLTHGQVILRTQFMDDIGAQSPNFSYTVVESCGDLDVNAQVYVGLPHTIHLCAQHKFDVIIIDEAHHFFFCPDGMVQSIIENSKPRFTMFLTGSPSKFIKENYKLYSISLLELYELGRVCSPTVELAKTAYDYTLGDYNNQSELKLSVKLSAEQTRKTLDGLLNQIQQVLESENRETPELRKVQKITEWNTAIRLLDKTMFVCRRQEQASLVKQYFNAVGVDVALSTSQFDEDSEQIARFKTDENCKILVVVNRGTLGFNMPTLVNVVDISGSINADVLFQMFARLVRRHPNEKGKLFLKVVPEAMAEYVYVLMSFVIALAHKQIYESYDGCRKRTVVPVSQDYLTRKRDARARKGTHRPRTLRFDELPALPRFEVMKSLFCANGDLLSSYAYTTLEEVSNRFTTSFIPFEEAREYARSLGLNKSQEWRDLAHQDNVPSAPESAYKSDWKGWGDWLGTGYIRRTSFISFQEARAIARASEWNTKSEWCDWAKLARPENIPSNPQLTYKEHWRGWGDWLGTSRVHHTKFLPFKMARAHTRSLGLKTLREWSEWHRCKRPSNIPSNPDVTYKDVWSGWGDFLGTGKVPYKDFLPFEEARAYARSLAIKLGKEWAQVTHPKNLPVRPDRFYKDEWISWGDFLGTIREEFPFHEEPLAYAQSLEVA